MIERRCEERGWKRVLLVSHAATIIALGRGLLDHGEGNEEAGPSTPKTDWSTGSGREIGAGTAGLSLYVRQDSPCLPLSSTHYTTSSPTAVLPPHPSSTWQQLLNGWCGHLPNGVEREWTFADIPGNVEEPGMGKDGKWVDEEMPDGGEEGMKRLEEAPFRILREGRESRPGGARPVEGERATMPRMEGEAEAPRSKF